MTIRTVIVLLLIFLILLANIIHTSSLLYVAQVFLSIFAFIFFMVHFFNIFLKVFDFYLNKKKRKEENKKFYSDLSNWQDIPEFESKEDIELYLKNKIEKDILEEEEENKNKLLDQQFLQNKDFKKDYERVLGKGSYELYLESDSETKRKYEKIFFEELADINYGVHNVNLDRYSYYSPKIESPDLILAEKIYNKFGSSYYQKYINGNSNTRKEIEENLRSITNQNLKEIDENDFNSSSGGQRKTIFFNSEVIKKANKLSREYEQNKRDEIGYVFDLKDSYIDEKTGLYIENVEYRKQSTKEYLREKFLGE